MAILFQFIVCCGTNQNNAEYIHSQFKGLEYFDTLGGDLFKDEYKIWWNAFTFTDLSAGHPSRRKIIEKDRRIEIIQKIYTQLKSFSQFEFAAMDWEAADRATDWGDPEGMIELNGIRVFSGFLDLRGIVISTDIWKELDQPSEYELFSDGFYWKNDLQEVAKDVFDK